MADLPLGLLTEGTGSLLGGLLLVVYAAITSLRKRRDVSITELLQSLAEKKQEIADLKAERTATELVHDAQIENLRRDVEALEHRVEAYRAAQQSERRTIHQLRLVLADHGITDPTA